MSGCAGPKRWLLAALWPLAACSEDAAKLTQIVAVIDSDLSVPAQLDALQIEVTGTKKMRVIDAALDAEHKLPRSLGLVYSGGPLGPLRVSVRGLHAGEMVVERFAEVHFRKDHTLKLALPLTGVCAEQKPSCESDQTCDQGECVPAAISLPEFDGNDSSFLPDAGPWVVDGRVRDPDAADGGDASSADGDSGEGSFTCTITEPADADKFYKGDEITFDGDCVGPDGAPLLPRWRSSLGAKLGTGAPLTKNTLGVGMHEISLCVDGTDTCAPTIQISVEALPELSATISSLVQAGASDGVYSADAEIVAKGKGSGVPPLELRWVDSLQGAVGSGETSVFTAPLLAGRHMLRLVVSDGRGRTISEERGFVVHAPGRSALFESYVVANAVLSSSGTVSALASDGVFHYVGTDAGSLLQVSADTTQMAGPSVTPTALMPPRPAVRDLFVHSSSNTLYLATSADVQACSIANGAVNGCTKLELPGLAPAVPRCVRRVTSEDKDYLLVGTSAGLWVGALTMLDQGSVRVNNAEFNAVTDNAGKLWIAGSIGLSGYTLGGNLSGSPATFDGASGGLKAIVASADAVWAALSSGITRYDTGDERWTNWTTGYTDAVFGRLVHNDVRSLAITHPVIDGVAHDVTWVATSAGLSRFDPAISSFTTYSKVDGLPDNSVLRVVGLPSNELLLATPSGLAIHRGQ